MLHIEITQIHFFVILPFLLSEMILVHLNTRLQQQHLIHCWDNVTCGCYIHSFLFFFHYTTTLNYCYLFLFPIHRITSLYQHAQKGVHEVMKKLRAHPLCVSVYVVYYACVARTFILVSLLCVCVCVCVLHNYLD